MPSLLALGGGYAVAPLLDRLNSEGWAVTATTRSTEKAAAFEAAGIAPLHWTAPSPLPRGAGSADAIIVSLPPRGALTGAEGFADGACEASRILYLSATSVYGDKGGAWTDEASPCQPGTARGQARLAAEEAWQAVGDRAGARVTRCRIAGIYGPGRNAVDSLRRDTKGAKAGLAQRVVKPGHVFNRIHRDDIARGLDALLRAERPPGILNFADDEPAPPQDVIAFAASLLGIEPPPEIAFDDAELSDMARSFYAENKRLRNDRLRDLTGPLLYPTYREGLAALV